MTLVIQPKNLRTLTWKHFRTVRRPKDDGSDASTGHEIQVSGRGKSLQVTLKLDKTNTWVISGKAKPVLLKHEQGHWDIAILKAEEIDRTLQATTEESFRSEFERVTKKYQEIDQQYDDETRHSMAAAKQEEWNCKFDAAKRNHTLDLSAICDP